MTSYINTWNIFSKSKLIQNIFKNDFKDKNKLIITKQENISKYQKILKEQKINLTIVDCMSKMVDFCFNNYWNYIVDSDIFFAKIDNYYTITQKKLLKITKNDSLEIDDFIKKLINFWYKYSDFLVWWDYKKLWDTLHIKIKDKPEIIAISFWWDIIETINILDWQNTFELKEYFLWAIENINFFNLDEKINEDIITLVKDKNIILDYLDIISWYEKLQNLENAYFFEILKNVNKEQINLKIDDVYIENVDNLVKTLKQDKNIQVYTKNVKQIENFIIYNNLENIKVHKTELNILKSYLDEKNIIICDDILSKIFVKKRLKRSISENLDLLLQIKPWDFIVHIDHWIWIFKQILEKTLWSIKKEYIEIEYKNNDKLFVPITEIKRLSKYIWKENPSLTGLSTKEWTKKLEKVNEDIELIAEELLEIYAERKVKKWFSFFIDRQEVIKFQRSFDYEYTLDQANAIEEILSDMQKETPMERILVWDVWFWKTEVAFNAIYQAILNKKQVIFISPLVVLAYEHYNKALSRFSAFGINIEVLTRFETTSRAKIVLDKLKKWQIDLIIWTHRLLSESITYKNLWLLIIDEEHKFWVKDKEKLKELKNNSHFWIDILSMSATPIPRSLNMALNGIRDISFLSKAPENRKWIETYVSKFDDNIIIQAWKREFERWWQLFFIHNRVETIEAMWKYLQELFPHKSVIITHGQLAWHELEDRILAFKRKEFDILLSSTVIENGIDFANVNTIIINDAYKFWISQIHQLRWRVWRSDKIWYCYLLFKRDNIKEDALKRLQTIVEYSHLWAWFELAVKDLEIRWWWDILGLRQSWTASEVWISVFLKMLEEKVEELKSSSLALLLKEKGISWENFTWEIEKTKRIDTIIDLNIWAYLWDDFFASELDKINFYREIESIYDFEDLDNMISDFKEINDNLTKENLNLFRLLKVRILASNYLIKSIKRAWVSYEIIFDDSLTVEWLKAFLDLDTKWIFIVIDLKKLKTSTLKFAWDEDFLDYLELIFTQKEQKERKVIKIKR